MEVLNPYRGREGEYVKDLANILNGKVFPDFADFTAGDEAELVARLNRLLIITPKIRTTTESEFFLTLRNLVEQWLSSGKSDEGECPRERNVPIQMLRDFVRRNPPYLGLEAPNGQLTLDLDPLSFTKSPLAIARDAATFLFLKLMDSAGRARLSRCDACERYFVRARMPKRDIPIYHGSFCSKCKGKAAMRRTSVSRNHRKKQMVELAANCWLRWGSTRVISKRSEWVASRINEKLPHWANPITGKWVTQNQAAIEAEATRRDVEGRRAKYGTRQKTRS